VLRSIHGGAPHVFGEDFCGSALNSVEWVKRVDGGRAVAVDHDEEVLARCPADAAIDKVHGDVVRDTRPSVHSADILYVGNFSIGELHSRHDLITYLRHARTRLRPEGIFACDLYGGESAFLTGQISQEHELPDGRTVSYVWEQREANPLTGMVTNVLHFRLLEGETVVQEMLDAFVYRWRLWGIPELRDALMEAGFAATGVFPKMPDAVDDSGGAYVTSIEDPDELDDSFVVLVAARQAAE
jgi:hypothetical protein